MDCCRNSQTDNVKLGPSFSHRTLCKFKRSINQNEPHSPLLVSGKEGGRIRLWLLSASQHFRGCYFLARARFLPKRLPRFCIEPLIIDAGK